MPKLSEHSSGQFVKLLYIGASGTGKTGSLVSLLPKYELRILDMDNGLDALVNFARTQCPDRLDAVDFETIRDKYKAGPQGPRVVPPARALVDAGKLMDKWSDGTVPAEWGADTIFVVDSLTALGRAALEWAKAVNPAARDPRQWYSAAQDVVENFIAAMTAESFRTNVIVCSHIDFSESETGAQKGYASSIGKALGPKLPRYFNTMLLAETSGSGQNLKRQIKTAPTAMLDLKNPAPMRIEKAYPLETGMLTLFEKLKGELK